MGHASLVFTNIGRAMFFGFSINYYVFANILRIAMMILLMGIFGIIDPETWDYKEHLIFSGAITAFIFLILIILYMLNKFLDNTFELTTTESADDLDKEEVPNGISKPLWQLRNAYQFDDSHVSDTALELIQNGFPAEEVFKLVDHMSKKPAPPKPKANNDENVEDYLRCCNSIYKFPWSRDQINAPFNHNTTFPYVVVSTILVFAECFTVSYSMKFYNNSQIWWICIAAGMSIYSVLCQPETDPYSFNHSEIWTGFTRPFFVALMNSILILCEKILEWTEKDNFQTTIPEFDLTIKWVTVLPHVEELCKYGIYLMMIFIFFVISPIHYVITWFLEFVSRYLFGCAGATGFFNSIFQFIRCCVVYVIVYFWEKEITFKTHSFLILAISNFILQIPLSNIPLRKVWIYLIQSLISSVIIYAAGLLADNIPKLATEIIILVLALLIDLIYPLLKTYNKYIFLYFGFQSKRYRFMGIVRYIWHVIEIGLIIGFLLKSEEQIRPFIFAFLVPMVINRFSSAPTAAVFSIIAFYFVKYEIGFDSYVGSAILAMWISRKCLTLADIIRHYMLGRMIFLEQLFCEDVSSDEFEMMELFLLMAVSVFVPFIDRSFQGLSLFWTAITGSPKHMPFALDFIQLPIHVRPNAFWNLFDTKSLDVLKTIKSHTIDHPLEAPIYLSAVQAFTKQISQLILDGTFGLVDENEFFILRGTKMCMILQIVAMSPTAISFQIRGLEYKSETFCHEVEIEGIDTMCQYVKNSISPSFFGAFQVSGLMWNVAALDIQLPMYDISNTELANVINTTTHENIILWLKYVSAYYISLSPELLLNVPLNSDEVEDLHEVFEFFGSNLDDASLRQANFFVHCIIRSFTSNWGSFGDKIFTAFHGNPTLDESESWIEMDERLIENILTPVAKLTLLSIFLEEASIVSPPELNEDLKDHFEHFHEDHCVASADSEEFALEFQKASKRLVCLEQCDNVKTVLFFIHSTPSWNLLRYSRESIRSLWASQAYEQMFFLVMDKERLSIQNSPQSLHNLINQSCDLPIGYPAFVSPILTSYYTPF